jgi:hypothetical protein
MSANSSLSRSNRCSATDGPVSWALGRVAWRLEEVCERFGEQTAEGTRKSGDCVKGRTTAASNAVGASTTRRDSTGISPDDQPQPTGTTSQDPSEEQPMSPHLQYEIARARQQEIASRAVNSHHSHAARTAANPNRANPNRRVKHRLGQVVATLGVLVAAGTAVTVSEARSNQQPMKLHAGHVSAQQHAREIRTFEGKGYVATSCTVSGTLMRNYNTGQSVTVK